MRMAEICARLSLPRGAIEYLRQAKEKTPGTFSLGINTNPSFDSLRENPQFRELIAELWRKPVVRVLTIIHWIVHRHNSVVNALFVFIHKGEDLSGSGKLIRFRFDVWITPDLFSSEKRGYVRVQPQIQRI